MTRKILLYFYLSLLFVSTQAAIVTIPYCAKAPTVDGYIDDVDEAWGTFVDLSARNPAGTTNAMTAKLALWQVLMLSIGQLLLKMQLLAMIQ